MAVGFLPRNTRHTRTVPNQQAPHQPAIRSTAMNQRLTLCLLALAGLSHAAEFPDVRKLVLAAKDEKAIAAAFTPADAPQKGSAVLTRAGDFLFAVRSPAASAPRLVIDDVEPALAMKRVGKSDLYVHSASLTDGTTHNFYYLVDGKKFGGRENVPAFSAKWSYDQPGVPQGKLSEKMIHESQIYPGTKTDWWIYVPAQYDPKTPAALMVWQDGEGKVKRDASRLQIAIDNLTNAKKIPVIIWVFISPASRQMRSIEYDRMDDTYARFIRDEISPKVAKMYNIRTDGYSRAIAGASSGGICAFNVAWHQPDQFSRVLSQVGSFTSIQWKAGERDGGNLYPFLIRKSPKKNIRAWLQDGYNDLENSHGSWPLQNLQMANSLKMMKYDFRLRWTTSFHGGGGGPDVPEGLIWLWRGYDPSKTSEEFLQDPAEATKPEFRVRVLNRPE